MLWTIIHYPAGDASLSQYTVRARSGEAAKRKLAAAIQTRR